LIKYTHQIEMFVTKTVIKASF